VLLRCTFEPKLFVTYSVLNSVCKDVIKYSPLKEFFFFLEIFNSYEIRFEEIAMKSIPKDAVKITLLPSGICYEREFFTRYEVIRLY